MNKADIVFLLDVDNTLLDNDRFGADLGARLEQAFGADQRDRYWAIFTALREALSYADYLAALQKFRFGLDVTRSCCSCRRSCWTTRLRTGCTLVRSK